MNLLFEISGNDQLSKVFHHINEEVKETKEKIEGVHSSMKNLLGTFGAGFAAFEMGDLIKDAYKEYKQTLEQQMKLQTMINNAPHDIRISMVTLREEAEKIGDILAKSSDDIMKTENILMRQPTISRDKERFEKSLQLSYDMAAAGLGGGDPNAIAKMLGKAMFNITKAPAILTAGGIDFNKKELKSLKESGQSEEGRERIVNLLTEKYKDFAVNLAKTDPLYEVTRSMEHLKDVIGPLAGQILTNLTPYIVDLATRLKGFLETVTKEDINSYISNIKMGIEALAIAFAIDKIVSITTGIASLAKLAGTSGFGAIAASPEGILVVLAAATLAKLHSDMNESLQNAKTPGFGTNISSELSNIGNPWQAKLESSLDRYNKANDQEAQGKIELTNLIHEISNKWMKTEEINDLFENFKSAGVKNPYEQAIDYLKGNKLAPDQQNNIPTGGQYFSNLFGIQSPEETTSAKLLKILSLYPNVIKKAVEKGTKAKGLGSSDDVTLNTIHGVKPTNIYITLNGGQGNFKIDKISTEGDWEDIQNKMTQIIETAISEGINEGQMVGMGR